MPQAKSQSKRLRTLHIYVNRVTHVRCIARVCTLNAQKCCPSLQRLLVTIRSNTTISTASYANTLAGSERFLSHPIMLRHYLQRLLLTPFSEGSSAL